MKTACCQAFYNVDETCDKQSGAYPGEALKNCMFSIFFGGKTGRQQQILIDSSRHRRVFLSLQWTLVNIYTRGMPKVSIG